LQELDDFVHLAFLDDHPMLYVAKKQGRVTDPIWLKIQSSILLDEGVRFCAGVSNRAGAVIIEAEILVPGFVPIERILEIKNG